MRKLLLVAVFLTASIASAQTKMCTISGSYDAPSCDSSNYLNVNAQAITPGTGATSLGKAEDAAHTSGDTGVMGLGVVSAGSDFAASNGDYVPFALSSKGALQVIIDQGYQTTTGTGILKAEDAATASGHSAVPIMGVVQTAPAAAGSVTANDYTFPNIDSATGGFYTVPVSSTARVCATITPDTNAFAANDIVGPASGASGLLTFASIFRAVVLSGTLTHVSVVNSETDSIAFDLCIFNADPSGSTYASNGAFTLAAADKQKLIGCTSVSDGRAFAAYELYQASNVNMAIDGASTSLYAILRTAGAPTWAAAQTVDVCLTVVQD